MSHKYSVSLTFDRCKVKEYKCSCAGGNDVFLCRHLVALIIYRMRNPEKVSVACNPTRVRLETAFLFIM